MTAPRKEDEYEALIPALQQLGGGEMLPNVESITIDDLGRVLLLGKMGELIAMLPLSALTHIMNTHPKGDD